MLQNAYLVAKIGADTAENEQHFAEILPTDAILGQHALRVRAQRGRTVAAGHGAPREAGPATRVRGGCASPTGKDTNE